MKNNRLTYLGIRSQYVVSLFFMMTFFSPFAYAQMPASMLRQTDYDTKAIMKQFQFDQAQEQEVYDIVKEKNNQILRIEMIQKKDQDLYQTKMKAIHDEMMQSLSAMMNVDQLKIYNNIKNQRKLKSSQSSPHNK